MHDNNHDSFIKRMRAEQLRKLLFLRKANWVSFVSLMVLAIINLLIVSTLMGLLIIAFSLHIYAGNQQLDITISDTMKQL